MPESSAVKTKIFLWVGGSRYVPIPEGYYRVLSGAAKPTDLMLCMLSFCKGEIVWQPVSEVFQDRPVDSRHIDCLIRQGSPVDKACPRCEGRAVAKGFRYCRGCCDEVRKELRDEQS